MAADSTMLRTMKRATALSFGTRAPLLSQNTRFTCKAAGPQISCALPRRLPPASVQREAHVAASARGLVASSIPPFLSRAREELDRCLRSAQLPGKRAYLRHD
jgi:hypothetical protein